MAAVQGRLQAIDTDTSDCRLWEHGAFRLSAENEAEKAAGTGSEALTADADDSTKYIYVSPSRDCCIKNKYWYVLFALRIGALKTDL